VGEVTVKAIFSFMGAGPTFETTLPAGYDQVPECSTPVFNGIGARSFVFIPAARAISPTTDADLVGEFLDGDGARVEFYKRREDPPLWRLHWPLTLGSLYTHLREEDDAEKQAPIVAGATSVVEFERANPMLLLDSPLEFAGSTWPGYAEIVEFFSSEPSTDRSVVFDRPGATPAGDIRTAVDGSGYARGGSGLGIDVEVAGCEEPAEAREILESVVADLREVDPSINIAARRGAR
jgi:hypothetical protein